MELPDTNCGFITRQDDRALTPAKVDPKAITAPHRAASMPSGDVHNATRRTGASQALAATMAGKWRNTRRRCSARFGPDTASSADGPPKGPKSPANSLEKYNSISSRMAPRGVDCGRPPNPAKVGRIL